MIRLTYLVALLALSFLFKASFLQGAVPNEGSYFDFRKVAKTATPAVVSIQVAGGGVAAGGDLSKDPFWGRFFDGPGQNSSAEKTRGQASGFLISKDGHIITNSHVVKGADEIVVVLQGGIERKATVIGFDENTDIGLIKIEGSDYPFLTLGDSANLEVGEWVVAIGAPLGLQATLTVGVVSAIDRNNLDLAKVEDFIQTDAAINQGNSGGPLLDLTGEVIGMNTAIVTNTDGGGYMGIGFAIPSNLIKHIYPVLKESGSVKRGYLGVSLKKLDEETAKSHGLKAVEGALIARVNFGSPAEKAGLKPGDVVTELEGRNIKDTAGLRNGVQMRLPGTLLKLKVVREGRPLYIEVELTNFPEGQATADDKGSN